MSVDKTSRRLFWRHQSGRGFEKLPEKFFFCFKSFPLKSLRWATQVARNRITWTSLKSCSERKQHRPGAWAWGRSLGPGGRYYKKLGSVEHVDMGLGLVGSVSGLCHIWISRTSRHRPRSYGVNQASRTGRHLGPVCQLLKKDQRVSRTRLPKGSKLAIESE